MAKVRKILAIGQTWRVLTDNDAILRIIPKREIKSISLVRGELIKVEHGQGCGCDGGCQELYIDWSFIEQPVSEDPNELLDFLSAMLNINPVGTMGLATENIQQQINTTIGTISNQLNQLHDDLQNGGGSGGGGGSINTDELEALVQQTNVLIAALQNHLSGLGLSTEETQQEVLNTLSDIVPTSAQIRDTLGEINTDTGNLQTLMTQTNVLVEDFKSQFNSVIPTNHAEIKNTLLAINTHIETAIDQLLNIVNGNSEANTSLASQTALLTELLSTLTDFSTTYETNFTTFQDTYSTSIADLQSSVNLLHTLLSQVDTHIQEVTTAVENTASTLNDILVVLGALLIIKEKLTSINLAHIFSQPSRIDQFESGVIYRGFTETTGVANNSPLWAISKETTDAGVTSILWANGTKDFVSPWDLRATLTYS